VLGHGLSPRKPGSVSRFSPSPPVHPNGCTPLDDRIGGFERGHLDHRPWRLCHREILELFRHFCQVGHGSSTALLLFRPLVIGQQKHCCLFRHICQNSKTAVSSWRTAWPSEPRTSGAFCAVIRRLRVMSFETRASGDWSRDFKRLVGRSSISQESAALFPTI